MAVAAVGCAQTNATNSGAGYRPTTIRSIETRGISSARCSEVVALVHSAALLYELEPALLVGIIRIESNFDAAARSRAGALGLMQVMPKTAEYNQCGNLLNPSENILCGAAVLAKLLNRYAGNIVYALSAYHAGFSWANAAQSKSGLPKNFAYVEKVLMARNWYLRHGCE